MLPFQEECTKKRGGKQKQWADELNVSLAISFVNAKEEGLKAKSWNGLSNLSKMGKLHKYLNHNNLSGREKSPDDLLRWFNRSKSKFKDVKERHAKSGGKRLVAKEGETLTSSMVSVAWWAAMDPVFGSDIALVPKKNAERWFGWDGRGSSC